MKALIVILLGLYGSWHLIDIHSRNILHNAVAPLMFFLFLVAFTIWLAMKLGPDKRGGSGDDGSGWSGGDFGDSGGFDGGGGDGGD